MADIYFWRQLFVLFTGLLYSLSIGFALAFPAVLNPAILSPNSTDIIRTTGDHASWIAAMFGIGGLFGAMGQSPIMQILGRKACHYSICGTVLVGWIILPFAKNIAALYSARFIQGISAGGIYINSIIISEYVHPSRRGYFIPLKKATIALGALCCHAMSIFWTWRQIAIFAAVPPFVGFILTFFWPESPSYLALKGRFSECETSFKWLNGNSEQSQRNLTSLVKGQREKIGTKTRDSNILKLIKTFMKKDFQKSFLITTLLTMSLDLCGRYYLMAYVIEIMMEILGNKTSAIYFTLAADFLTLLAISLSTIVISYIKRRTVLFSSGVFAVLLMLTICVLAYLKTVYTFSKYFLWVTALIITLQCFIVNIGLIPVAFVVIGEIFPLEYKGLGACTSTVVFTGLYAVILKITPVFMEYTGVYGTYAIYGLLLALCLAVLYKILPETKDKTLQQIEEELNGNKQIEMIPMEREKLMH